MSGLVRFRAVVNGVETVLKLTPEEGAARGFTPVDAPAPVVPSKKRTPANKSRMPKMEE